MVWKRYGGPIEYASCWRIQPSLLTTSVGALLILLLVAYQKNRHGPLDARPDPMMKAGPVKLYIRG